MREIKFRAWDKRAKKMYQVEDLGVGKESWSKTATNYTEQPKTGYNKFYPEEVEVMQYTGLKDKNGKEIYEGDIVECLNNIHSFTTYIVIYSGGAYRLIPIYDHDRYLEYQKQNSRYENSRYRRVSSLFRKNTQIFNVIGNIYENPELVKEM